MKGLILLNALSGVWYVLGTSAAVLFLIEPRFSRRTTRYLYIGVMIPTFAFLLYYYGLYGSERGGQASLLIFTLPTLILFFLLSKHRDGRPIFTYFFINCLSLEIILITNILNTCLTPETYYINFFGRLALYPLFCLWIWRRVSEPFRYVLQSMEKGWGAFALVAALSTVFANALENAIQAVRPLPQEKRIIRCECIRRPQLMFSVSNPYEGTVRFDEEGRPVALKKGHGFGTASIAAYCEKHGAFCDYAAENGWFTLRMVQP